MISVILGSQSNIDYLIGLRAILASYLLALAIYIYNDVTDFKVDSINKPSGPTITGKITKNQLLFLVLVLFSIAILLTVSINLYSIIIAGIFLALGIIYSHPKTNWKEKFPLKTVVTAAGAGLLSLLGGAAVGNVSSSVFYAALLFFTYFFILGPLGDIGDLKGDRAVGRRTFPIVIGIIPTVLVILSTPLLILFITLFSYESLGMSLLGTIGIIGVCCMTFVLLLNVSRRLKSSWIKGIRSKIRFLHVLLQCSLLVAFM